MKDFAFDTALKSLLSNPKKFLYPIIGTITGIAAVTAIFALAAGGKAMVENDLALLSENRIVIKGVFKRTDIEMIERLTFVNYLHLTDAVYESGGLKMAGYSDKALRRKNLPLLKEGEMLLERSIAKKRAIEAGDFIGMAIDRERVNLRAIDTFEDSAVLKRPDMIVSLIYFDKLFHIFDNETRLLVAFHENEDAVSGGAYIMNILKQRNPYMKYLLIEDDAAYRRIKKIRYIITVMLTAISAVSLLGAGISISSILSSSVRERRHEIGILMAMGTGRGNIRDIFLIEALILSFISGIMGIILGVGMASLVGKIAGIYPIFHIGSIALILITSVVLGAFAGFRPADAASKMRVVEALKV